MRKTPLFAMSLACVLASCQDVPELVGVAGRMPRHDVVSVVTGPALYTTFGPGLSYDNDPYHSWTINGYFSPTVGQQAIAQRFSLTAPNYFGSAQVALVGWPGYPHAVRVYLHADAGGVPGTVLDSVLLSDLTTTPTIYTAVATWPVPLAANAYYWVSVVAAAPGVLDGWQWANISGSYYHAGTQGGSSLGPWSGGWTSTPTAYQVNAPATPQAFTAALAEAIDDLHADGSLSYGQARSLSAKLSALGRAVAAGNTHSACGQAGAFINQVESFVKTGVLTGAAAQNLIAWGSALRGLLNC